MKTITHSQYLQLIGLQAIAKEAQARMTEVVKSAVEITGEKDSEGIPELSGHTCDIMYDNRGLDEGLRIMKVAVAKA